MLPSHPNSILAASVYTSGAFFKKLDLGAEALKSMRWKVNISNTFKIRDSVDLHCFQNDHRGQGKFGSNDNIHGPKQDILKFQLSQQEEFPKSR